MPIRFQVDADFYDHPKTIGMNDSATALWVRAGSYSAAKLTDGFVADAVLSLLSRCPVEAASELVERGLWRRVRGGYKFHQWDGRNLTRAQVETQREYERDKKRRQRNGQVNSTTVPMGLPPAVPRDSLVSPDTVVSVSESVSVLVSGVPPGQPETVGPEPPKQCPIHLDDPDPPACRRCRDARQRWEAWQADKRRRVDEAPDCPLHAGSPAHNCGPCRSERLGAA